MDKITSRMELIEMGALTLRRAQKAEARAEAAEKQLAEAREAIPNEHRVFSRCPNCHESSVHVIDCKSSCKLAAALKEPTDAKD